MGAGLPRSVCGAVVAPRAGGRSGRTASTAAAGAAVPAVVEEMAGMTAWLPLLWRDRRKEA